MTTDPTQIWLRDLRRREAAGEVKVQWSRAREPSCIHSGDGRGSGYTQPASWCQVCKDSPELAAWRDYWRGLGATDD